MTAAHCVLAAPTNKSHTIFPARRRRGAVSTASLASAIHVASIWPLAAVPTWRCALASPAAREQGARPARLTHDPYAVGSRFTTPRRR